MNLTIRQRQQLHRGRNHLLDACYRDMGRAAFRKELIGAAAIVVLIVVLWSL